MEGSSWHSYPKIFAIGHAALKDLFEGPVAVEEKIDGSQFSFGLFDDGLRVRSKGAQIVLDSPPKMFVEAVATVRELESRLVPGWTYRAEYLQKPKHNVLAYDRIPAKHLIIFDINPGHENYITNWQNKAERADALGLEVVPNFRTPRGLDEFKCLLGETSILGGQKIEGVVVKNYGRFAPDCKALMGKYVSEAYKEVQCGEWRKSNPTRGDIVEALIASFKTPARWEKAVQHLRERGELENSPRDIGKLIREIPADIQGECEDEIKARLFAHAWPQIYRGVVGGVAEWYKRRLLADQKF